MLLLKVMFDVFILIFHKSFFQVWSQSEVLGYQGHLSTDALMQAMLCGKSSNTIKTYYYNFKNWKDYALSRDLTFFPCNNVEFMIYLIDRVSQGASMASINGYINAAKFFHKMFLAVERIEIHENVMTYLKKFALKPNQRRRPLLKAEYELLLEYCFSVPKTVQNLQNALIIIFCWNGLLRFDDLQQLRLGDCKLDTTKIELQIRQAKNDYAFKGQQVSFILPEIQHFLLLEYLHFSGLQTVMSRIDVFLFPKILPDKVCANDCISYNFVRETVLKCCLNAKVDVEKVGLHSFRVGACTQASQNLVPDYVIDHMGRWAQGSRARQGYQRLLDADIGRVSNILN